MSAEGRGLAIAVVGRAGRKDTVRRMVAPRLVMEPDLRIARRTSTGTPIRGWVQLTQAGAGWSESAGPAQMDIYTGWGAASACRDR